MSANLDGFPGPEGRQTLAHGASRGYGFREQFPATEWRQISRRYLSPRCGSIVPSSSSTPLRAWLWRFAILASTGLVNSAMGAGVRVIIEQLEVVGWDELEVDEILQDSNRSGGAGQLSPWKGGQPAAERRAGGHSRTILKDAAIELGCQLTTSAV